LGRDSEFGTRAGNLIGDVKMSVADEFTSDVRKNVTNIYVAAILQV